MSFDRHTPPTVDSADKCQPESTAGGNRAPSPESKVLHYQIPVGTHVIRLSDSLATYLYGLVHEPVPPLIATRVWIRQTRDELFLHLGDLEPGILED